MVISKRARKSLGHERAWGLGFCLLGFRVFGVRVSGFWGGV